MKKTSSTSSQGLFFGNLHNSELENILVQYKSSQKIIIVDENTHDYCLEYLITSYEDLKDAEVILLPAGEQNKVLEVCFQVWQALSEYQIKRNDLVINLGGGVVTDMGGFIASVYKRGLNFINIPTSLLGMVDASVGGKTGIDLGSFKNQLGVFAFPELVICDPGFLHTLPPVEFLSGKAEMLKHGLIADAEHWRRSLELNAENIKVDDIKKSVLIKKKIVDADPFERKERKKLNFGHTIGHALEGFLLEKNPHPHGFCVAWGMVTEAYLSFKEGILPESDFLEIQRGIHANYPDLPIKEGDISHILHLMKNDKKNDDDTINFNLIKAIGDVEANHTFAEKDVENAIINTLLNK